MRKTCLNTVYELAKKDKKILFIGSDLGPGVLNDFKKNIPERFFMEGVSEQSIIGLSAGLALEGKKVFMYAMAPFITLRCLEQHKCCTAIMNLPINTIIAGIGLGYADSGPTHYTTEDTACLKSLVGSKIYTASDAYSASLIAKHLIKNKFFSFSRLERLPVKKIYSKNNLKDKDINNGFKIIKSKNKSKKNLIITQGYQIHRLL